MQARRAAAFLLASGSLLLLAACGADDFDENEKKAIRSLSLAALPERPIDPSNRVSGDPRAAAFGALLFTDTGLSGNASMSCATCHKPERQFQDDLPRGVGAAETDRRTMPLAGVAWSPWQFWDGRRDSLWAQALAPLEDAREHAGNRTAFAHHLAARHARRYAELFGPLPALDHLPADAGPKGTPAERAAWAAMSPDDREAVNRVFSNLGKALAAFEETLRPPQTRFDRFAAAMLEGREPEAGNDLSDLEREGLKLFIGKANCLECHNGPRFTDDHFHNTGVPPVAGRADDAGRADGIAEVLADPFNCLGTYSDAEPDACTALRFMRRDRAAMQRAYKTPSLRGAASRPPYMHAGQFASLDEVIDHYSRAPAAVSGRTELRGVVLTERGRKALVAFLKTLDPQRASDP
ncbi:cytochrome-c peroxidase [Nitratireductor sp. ZSWI3]|uniref:cytochrome-c peroxidase n=1 Tax=Nitratireductor sp. ZSWI3 TaxID=2966359 RepID=UPI00214FEFBF|nr:cytochrome c peroxidase [Nitratireductor sp. ZSWI3]MCR4266224.1 methylamine utilization protein [Nitratireductor sp. ZSWI3]